MRSYPDLSQTSFEDPSMRRPCLMTEHRSFSVFSTPKQGYVPQDKYTTFYDSRHYSYSPLPYSKSCLNCIRDEGSIHQDQLSKSQIPNQIKTYFILMLNFCFIFYYHVWYIPKKTSLYTIHDHIHVYIPFMKLFEISFIRR